MNTLGMMGIALKDIKNGDLVEIFSDTAGKLYFVPAGWPEKKSLVSNDVNKKQQIVDRCKRMVVVKKKFSNEEDKL